MSTAREIMTKHVVYVDPDAPVEEAIDLMLRHGVSGLPVVASCGELLGVITEYDLIGILGDPATEQSLVYHFMTRDPNVIDVDTRLFELSELFQTNSIRRYPVVEDGKLVGIVSRRELIRFVRQARDAVRECCEVAAV